MAKWSILVLALAALVGCQSQQTVENLPQPNFNGPNVAQAPVVMSRPAPVLPPVVGKAPAPKPRVYAGAVPKDWIPRPGAHRDWYWIVIHHSATPSGSEKVFDREHKEKGWDECGYDFVIGNGTDSGNGQVEVGPRWPIQKYGAHAYTPDERFNQHGIGICLVGNFEVDRPTAAQMASLTKLVKYLMVTYNIPINRVLRHKDTKSTACPGRNFNIDAFRRAVQQQLVDAGEPIGSVGDHLAGDDLTPPGQPITAAAELLHDEIPQPAP